MVDDTIFSGLDGDQEQEAAEPSSSAAGPRDVPLGDAPQERDSEPDTKEAFNALRGEYQNSWHQCAEYFQDKDLQKRLRLVTMGLGPLEQEFFCDCEEQKGGPKELAQWAARRATGAWSQCICETLQLFHSDTVYQRLGMVIQCVPSTWDDPSEPSWVQEDRHWSLLLYNMVIEVAAARAWSQCMWSIFLPQLVAGLLLNDHMRRDSVLSVIKRVGMTLLKAEAKTHIPGLRKCLDAIAFHKTQLVREFLKMAEDRLLNNTNLGLRLRLASLPWCFYV